LHDVLETPGGGNENKPKQRDKGMKGTQTTRVQVNKETMDLLKVKTSQTRDTTMTEDMSHLKGTSQQ
jgi:outer membrane lipoprotein-sorting protein